MSISECTFHGEQESRHCGYCDGKKSKSRITHGATFSILTTDDYQSLMFRGWRRSGSFCYKPTMDRICCPHYTIRCDVNQFQLSRSHRRVLQRMDAFLRTGVKPARPSKPTASADGSAASSQANNSNAAAEKTSPRLKKVPQPRPSASGDDSSASAAATVGDVDGAGDAHGCFGVGRGIRMREGKARQKRWMRRLAKLRAKASVGVSSSSSATDASSTAAFEAVMVAYHARRLARAATRAPKTLEQMLELEGGTLPGAAKAATEAAAVEKPRRLRIVLLPSARREFDSGAEHALYASYQTVVHDDAPSECRPQQFRRFLCESPLVYARRGDRWLGSFHQQYWLEPEGRLIMVGVLDILPDCTSSVYVFYDPEYACLNLGTYAALREIAYTRQLGLPHYCMGYYIHDCVKMRYKGAFAGSQLLCPETYTWYGLREICLPLLNDREYCRFAPMSVPSASSTPAGELQVAIGGSSFMPYRELSAIFAGRSSQLTVLDKLVQSFANLVGPECVSKIRVRIG